MPTSEWCCYTKKILYFLSFPVHITFKRMYRYKHLHLQSGETKSVAGASCARNEVYHMLAMSPKMVAIHVLKCREIRFAFLLPFIALGSYKLVAESAIGTKKRTQHKNGVEVSVIARPIWVVSGDYCGQITLDFIVWDQLCELLGFSKKIIIMFHGKRSVGYVY